MVMKAKKVNEFEIKDGKTTKTMTKICQIDTKDVHKSYLVYTDNLVDESGFTKAYASVFDATKNPINLDPIETDEEWDLIEKFLYEMEDKKEEFE